MKKIKVLNLYGGIGGNRKLWKNVDVTTIENNKEIAKIYQDNFPKDKVIIKDAHKYLLKHFQEFDFIWASPPCKSHSDIRRMNVDCKGCKPLYPDLKLYEEIIFLKCFCKCKWVVENVVPYYKPLINSKKIGRHLFWANFIINEIKIKSFRIKGSKNYDYVKALGFDLSKYKIKSRKDQIYRNCVHPELGLHIFNCAFKIKQEKLI